MRRLACGGQGRRVGSSLSRIEGTHTLQPRAPVVDTDAAVIAERLHRFILSNGEGALKVEGPALGQFYQSLSPSDVQCIRKDGIIAFTKSFPNLFRTDGRPGFDSRIVALDAIDAATQRAVTAMREIALRLHGARGGT